jgi:hypothetical protein
MKPSRDLTTGAFIAAMIGWEIAFRFAAGIELAL